MAPAASKIVAIKIAWGIVRALEDTDVPKELATSFAPIAKQYKQPKMIPAMVIHSRDGYPLAPLYVFLNPMFLKRTEKVWRDR